MGYAAIGDTTSNPLQIRTVWRYLSHFPKIEFESTITNCFCKLNNLSRPQIKRSLSIQCPYIAQCYSFRNATKSYLNSIWILRMLSGKRHSNPSLALSQQLNFCAKP